MAERTQEPASESVPERDRAERGLLPRHCEGDETAFAELLEAYRAPVYGYLVRTGVAASARDDLFQEAFLKIHQAAPRYEPSRPLKPWVFTIVANAVRNHFRDRSRRRAAPFADGGGEDLPDPAPGPHRVASAREAASRLEGAIRDLPLPHREAVALCCLEGMDRKAASAALGIPVNTLKTHLRRARIALARAMEEEGSRS